MFVNQLMVIFNIIFDSWWLHYIVRLSYFSSYRVCVWLWSHQNSTFNKIIAAEMSEKTQDPPPPPSLGAVLVETVRGMLWGRGSGHRGNTETSLTREDVNYLLDMDGVGLCFHEIYKSKQAFKKQWWLKYYKDIYLFFYMIDILNILWGILNKVLMNFN